MIYAFRTSINTKKSDFQIPRSSSYFRVPIASKMQFQRFFGLLIILAETGFAVQEKGFKRVLFLNVFELKRLNWARACG